MLLYKKTFDNIKTMNFDFPIEDQYYSSLNEAIVADGITRDPIGIPVLTCSEKEGIKKYPRPSGAELAAKAICDTFAKSNGSLKERLIACNASVKALNDKYIKECDYLENDYYGAVVSCIHIENNILNYAYICDCGVIVYDSLGNIKFQTEDDKEKYSDPYIKQVEMEISWDFPETRAKIRREYRNNLENIRDGKCVSYGALTGEIAAHAFIRDGQIELQTGDIIVVYSDGFTNFLHEAEFISLLSDFKQDTFEEYVNSKALSDYEKYGKEKTLVLFKN